MKTDPTPAAATREQLESAEYCEEVGTSFLVKSLKARGAKGALMMLVGLQYRRRGMQIRQRAKTNHQDGN